MPNTITAYVGFTAATKAKSGEVNANFSNHRGTLVPIEENTAAASNFSHDLGATDHFWRTGYLQTLNIALTSTALAPITVDTAGALHLGTANTSAGAIVGDDGLTLTSFKLISSFTTAAGVREFASAFNASLSLTTSTVTAASITLDISNHRPIMVGFYYDARTWTTTMSTTLPGFIISPATLGGHLTTARRNAAGEDVSLMWDRDDNDLSVFTGIKTNSNYIFDFVTNTITVTYTFYEAAFPTGATVRFKRYYAVEI